MCLLLQHFGHTTSKYLATAELHKLFIKKLHAHLLGCKMCDDKCSEANERDDQSNIRKTLQHYTIHTREGSNIAFCEILCSYTEREGEVYKHEVLYAS